MNLHISHKPFSFKLKRPLKTSQRLLIKKQGWLLHIHDKKGNIGWGEVAPINSFELDLCATIIDKLKQNVAREELESMIKVWPNSLNFGFGSALGEIDSLIGKSIKINWLKAPRSCMLIPTNQSSFNIINRLTQRWKDKSGKFILKLKIGILDHKQEKELIKKIFEHLPKNTHIRLDANGGLSYKLANEWVEYLINEPKLEWLEQPLAPNDLKGLNQLSKYIPIALDESLIFFPDLFKSWGSWQIRHPLFEGDPRKLLQELHDGFPFRVISTGFETGIGLRWIEHLAAIQTQGPTPTAPGLAPGWCPKGDLFSRNPHSVWEAA